MGVANQGVRRSGGNAVRGDPEYGNWPKINREIKTKNKEKGRGSGRGIHFLIGNTFRVTFNSHNVGGEWTTGEEQIMRICTRPNTNLARITDS